MNHVHQCLNDNYFNETLPRPPIPGEENEKLSSGTSTRSTGSQKSHNSGKFVSSNSEGYHSFPTPRRSNLDKTAPNTSLYKCSDEVDAPLGFEPEGSEANSPRFTDRSNDSPSYLKWAENFKFLLGDSDGVKLFKKFLDQEQCSNLLDFWFACRGLKMVSANDTKKIYGLVKLIYKKYIKGDVLVLKHDVKKNIVEDLKHEKIDQSIFDQAQKHVEDIMRDDSYPLFIKSDIYVQYVSCGGDSPKTSDTSSGSNSIRPGTGPLPTLTEGEELKNIDCGKQLHNSVVPINLTPSGLFATRFSRQSSHAKNPRKEASVFLHNSSRGTLNPYHVSYAPVSAQDSELQSLSSDALTDDTMSLTDSSLDGREAGCKKWKRKAIHRNAQLNKQTELTQSCIPRTERAPKDRNFAESEPAKFAAQLIEKLERVKEERDNLEKIKALKLGETTDEEDHVNGNTTRTKTLNDTSMGSTQLKNLIETAMSNNPEDDNAQSILEDHCSRVWDSSMGQTPVRSPGQSPDRSRRRLAVYGHNLSFNSALSKSHNAHSKHKESDHSLISALSFDESKLSVSNETETNKLSRSHHISKDKKDIFYSNEFYTSSGHSDPGILTIAEDRGRLKDSKKSSKKSNDGNNSENTTNMYESSSQNVPNLHDPANEKVLSWILESEKVKTNTGQDSDKSSSHKRSSHRSNSSHSHRQSTKKPSHNNSNSWSSVECSAIQSSFQHTDLSQNTEAVLPNQPIIQDPSMPLLNPPHPTTQLEEAKRRLEDERLWITKSRSFTSSSSKERKCMPPPGLIPSNKMHTTSRLHTTPNTSMEMSVSEDLNRSIERKQTQVSRKHSNGSTVVGYYFCGEAIPYRTTIPGKNITLLQFKDLIAKRGNYRYFFKKASDEFDTGAVLEEVSDDREILPLWDGKVVGKVEKVE